LLVNAADDSFLSEYCFPEKLAMENPDFYFCKPRWGGHVGFLPENNHGFLWSEEFAYHFLKDIHENGNYKR
jgi:predicted alpha/beta-fold hydrolase